MIASINIFTANYTLRQEYVYLSFSYFGKHLRFIVNLDLFTGNAFVKQSLSSYLSDQSTLTIANNNLANITLPAVGY
ncbi:hypothetical protein C3B55_00166 [Candidatus Pseudomonas adelgestsugas]|uniref:Uncharacterized protein n=1 Tax=Candidatus Pseudomonas adelgestsugas TaxID=1302376 RepID=A0ABX5R7X3_9PSED|nr:hypothetical protein C3B55_00166 [Candidatus Pseudomonas adelgestsugas]